MLTEALVLSHLSWDKAALTGVARFMWAAHAPPAAPLLICWHRPLEEGLAHLSIPTTSTPELTMRLLAVLSWLWDTLHALGCPSVPFSHHLWPAGILWLMGPFSSTKSVLWKANSRCSPMWGTLLPSESSYSWQVLPCPSMDRNPLLTGRVLLITLTLQHSMILISIWATDKCFQSKARNPAAFITGIEAFILKIMPFNVSLANSCF